ncbi:MAG: hypothetical protein JWN08_2761 [Frankiales bacterium]|nr:hypothetical protein [Frankiales bacterium]
MRAVTPVRIMATDDASVADDGSGPDPVGDADPVVAPVAVRSALADPPRPVRPLPVVASVAARPTWLAAAALVGVAVGVLASGGGGYTASTSLQISGTGSDSLRVKQVAQTVERLATSSGVLDAAAQERGVPASTLAGRVSAAWQEDTDLVTVSATGPDAAAAAADANAVAEAAVATSREGVEDQLQDLRRDANRLLTVERLSDADAEAARKSQLGSSLASRQDAVSAQTNGLFVADPAVSAAPGGLGRTTGAVAGLLGGLLLAALASVAAGTRWLRLGRGTRVVRLLPDVEVATPAQAAEVAGQVVQSRTSCLAIVSLPGTGTATSLTFALVVADFVREHGRSVTVVDVASLPSAEARRGVLRHDARTDVQETFGTDVAVVVVDSQDDAFQMLVGQGGFMAAVVGRPRTPLQSLVAAVSSLDRTRPVVITAP